MIRLTSKILICAIVLLPPAALAKISVDPHPTNPEKVLLTWSVRLPVVPAGPRTNSPMDRDEQGERDALGLLLGLMITCNQSAVDQGVCAPGKLGQVIKRKVLCTQELVDSGDCAAVDLNTEVPDPRGLNQVINDEYQRRFEQDVRDGRRQYRAEMEIAVDSTEVEPE